MESLAIPITKLTHFAAKHWLSDCVYDYFSLFPNKKEWNKGMYVYIYLYRNAISIQFCQYKIKLSFSLDFSS